MAMRGAFSGPLSNGASGFGTAGTGAIGIQAQCAGGPSAASGIASAEANASGSDGDVPASDAAAVSREGTGWSATAVDMLRLAAALSGADGRRS